ncbi:uncharacterized protein EI90DRAFT_3138844 [Cantharellus anzutake]|uniref:uncharacterized protein n=1 Tax=Cantharellus anzutake TaxID=1750568 RepID=UPI0019031718|nr:uncharacterized protein EI90DRAFT_3138844 [Cantharellus anzutake]KAF8311021.1 hypothetical protein EI90DRAFT_3138844 [Cantharellus anzutake]
MPQTKTEETMLQHTRPIAQRVFDSFVWTSRVRYRLTTEEMNWFHQSVSDRFVEDFSVPYQVHNWKPDWGRIDLKTIEEHISTHIFTTEMSYMVQRRLAVPLTGLRERLDEVHPFTDVLDRLGQPSIMLINYGGQTLPIMLLASKSIEDNEGWGALRSEILDKIPKANEGAATPVTPVPAAPSSTPTAERMQPQPRRGEPPPHPTEHHPEGPIPPQWRLPDPLTVSLPRNTRSTAPRPLSIRQHGLGTAGRSPLLDAVNAGIGVDIITPAHAPVTPAKTTPATPSATPSATSFDLTEFNTPTATQSGSSICTDFPGTTTAPGSMQSVSNISLPDRRTDLAPTQHHLPLTQANVQQLSSSQLSSLTSTHSMMAATEVGSQSLFESYVNVHTTLWPEDIEIITLKSQLGFTNITNFCNMLMTEFDCGYEEASFLAELAAAGHD